MADTRIEIEQTNRRGLLSQLSKEEMKRISGGYQLTTVTARQRTVPTDQFSLNYSRIKVPSY